MLLTVLQAKIHRATVTDAQLHYEGSITIDAKLLEASGIQEFQQVDIYNISSGKRFTTYTLKGKSGSGIIQINGAAAHLAKTGELIIIAAYGQITKEEAEHWKPKLVFVDSKNMPTDFKPPQLPI